MARVVYQDYSSIVKYTLQPFWGLERKNMPNTISDCSILHTKQLALPDLADDNFPFELQCEEVPVRHARA